MKREEDERGGDEEGATMARGGTMAKARTRATGMGVLIKVGCRGGSRRHRQQGGGQIG